eukprot:352743-Chlamydomonas_euryale.AAC.11
MAMAMADAAAAAAATATADAFLDATAPAAAYTTGATPPSSLQRHTQILLLIPRARTPQVRWMTQVSSSVYATPLITDLYSDGRKDIVVPSFVHYLEALKSDEELDESRTLLCKRVRLTLLCKRVRLTLTFSVTVAETDFRLLFAFDSSCCKFFSLYLFPEQVPQASTWPDPPTSPPPVRPSPMLQLRTARCRCWRAQRARRPWAGPRSILLRCTRRPFCTTPTLTAYGTSC